MSWAGPRNPPFCSMMTGSVANVGIRFGEVLLFCWIASIFLGMFKIAHAICVPSGGCKVALACYTYNATEDGNLTAVASLFQATEQDIRWYSHINESASLQTGTQLFIPFECDCVEDQLGHNFSYTVVRGDQVDTIATEKYELLTRVPWMVAASGQQTLDAIYPQNILMVPVNCSCGNPDVSSTYGLFATYVARDNDNPSSLSRKFNIARELLQQYNSDLNLDNLKPNNDIIFVPARDGNGSYPPFNDTGLGSDNKSSTAVVGASVGGAIALLVVGCLLFYFCVYRPRKQRKVGNMDKHQSPLVTNQSSAVFSDVTRPYSEEGTFSNVSLGNLSSSLGNFNADRSVEFSYEELAAATDNFSIAHKIGQGGYGSVFYAEIRGQKLAIKMMNMQATKEFLAELKVLTRVHHTNLVRLVGYCTVESLFLVYEYVENGTLSQHLQASRRGGSTTLQWDARVQIALDAARGLEYIHEHTTPTYIHRDIKSSNILLDKSFRAKVADFGLTKLTESSGISNTLPSRLVGTFGYMAPEYARFGDVSPKADVYSFGVVLFEIISAKEAIVHNVDTASVTQPNKGNSKGLVMLFENELNEPDGKEKLRTLVDPALHDDYPLESVWKMANLARACTREQPMLRPNMRVVVVALMTLSSSTQEWEAGSDNGMSGLMSGR